MEEEDEKAYPSSATRSFSYLAETSTPKATQHMRLLKTIPKKKSPKKKPKKKTQKKIWTGFEGETKQNFSKIYKFRKVK
jgi:hypothetical protein